MQTHGIYLVQELRQNEIFLSKKLMRKTMLEPLRLCDLCDFALNLHLRLSALARWLALDQLLQNASKARQAVCLNAIHYSYY